MQTLVLETPGVFAWKEAAEPEAGPGEVLVRVRRCGVCGTDIHAFAGRQPFFTYPRRLGHELAVEVLDAPADAAVKPGDVCAVEPYYFCGSCAACRAGKTNCCRSLQLIGVHIDGGHAPLLAVPADKLHPHTTLSLEELALVEPLIIGAHAVERAALVPGEPAAVVGMGPIGLGVALYAKAAGADLAVVDINEDRLDFARQALGTDQAVMAGDGLPERLRSVFGGDLPRAVFDATGSPPAMHASFALPDHGGRMIFVGLFQGDFTFPDPDFHRREMTLLSSRNGRPDNFRHVLASLEDGSVDARPLITHRFHFDEMPARFPELTQTPGLIKAMITIGD